MRRALPLLLLLGSARALGAPEAGATGDTDAALPAAFAAEPGANSEAASPLRYAIEAIEVRGNRKTDASIIRAELGLAPGDVVTPEDPRVRAAELRLLSLGFFLRVELRLTKGHHRGDAVR